MLSEQGHNNKKEFNWPLAKAIEVYPCESESERVDKMETQNGLLIRPVQRLDLLEITSALKRRFVTNIFFFIF